MNSSIGRLGSALPFPFLLGWRRAGIDDLRLFALSLVLVAATVITATSLMSFVPEATDYVSRGGDGSMRRQIIHLSCVAMTLLLTRPLANPQRLLPFPPSVFVLLGFCVLSLTWSATPSVGFRRLILTFIFMWIGFRIVDELGYRRAMNVMAMGLVGILVADYMSIAMIPAAIHQGFSTSEGSLAGNWRGIMAHKNDAGPVTAVTILLLVFGRGRMPRIARWIAIAAAAYFLVRTHSKTSIGLVGLGCIIGFAYSRYNPAYRVLLAPFILIFGAVLIYAATIYIPPFMSMLDSSEDAFTGRVQIWQTMIAYLHDNPIWGAGFGSFWDSGPVSPANIYGRNWVSKLVAQGHNGYLDLWTQIGIVGMLLAVAVLFVIPAAKLLVTRHIPRWSGAAALAVLAFQFAHNFTETSILTRDYFGNFMLCFIVACIHNMVRSHRFQGLEAVITPRRVQLQRADAS